MWGRHCYRISDHHLEANAKDGHGLPWPIRYKDLQPWYDYVETFIGVNGTIEGISTMPDGKYQPSMGFNAGEQRFADAIKAHYPDRRLVPGRTANLTQAIGDRQPCQNRNQCARGCSFGAYFSSQSSTLPAARATGRLTMIHDSVVERIDYDAKTKRATGVQVIDAKSGARSTQTARIVFVCANAYDSVALMMRSQSEALPGGLGSSGGVLGQYLTDHAYGPNARATIPGLDNAMYLGRKPNGVTIPRFVNVDKQETDFIRGYSFQGAGSRESWARGGDIPGLGAALKQELRRPGAWGIVIHGSIEVLPRPSNKLTLNWAKRDRHGLPLTRIDVTYGENERKAAVHAKQEAVAMLSLMGGQVLSSTDRLLPPGTAIHDMGGACMGDDPRRSVTNAFNQIHDAPNVFVTDGSVMCSAGDKNPSITYMAMTARACAHAVELLKQNAI
jgi:choline dehydrogenase-like flavoprotein